MILAATAQSFSLDNLPVNWFDFTILGVLCFGLFRGRKNGMTKEILPTAQWICIVVAAAFAYPLAAQYLDSTCGLGKAWSASLAYFAAATVIWLIFTFIKKALARRLEGSNVFGSSEYYLGMFSGMIRYGCIALFFVALSNAPHYTAADIAAKAAYNKRWYGGGMYDGNYVPDFNNIQDAVFKNSFSGPYIKDYAAIMLVQTGPADTTTKTAEAAPKKAQTGVIHIGK
jgi:uncharacterized membrane protein required for colicin V production